MDIRLKLITVFFVVATGSVGTVQAANTITFTGDVSDATCQVDLDGGTTTVAMGTVSKTDLDTNSFSAAKDFKLKLTGCPTAEGSKTQAKITIDGDTDSTNSDYSKNQAEGATAATGVGIAIYEGSSGSSANIVKSHTEGSVIDISSGSAEIAYTVKMAKAGTVGKGTITSTVTYNVTYY